MINSVYGKGMKYLRKRISVTIVSNEKDYLKKNSKPTFISTEIFDKNYAAIPQSQKKNGPEIVTVARLPCKK